jgi:hypothetical protein
MRTQRLLNAGLFTVLAGLMVACGNPFAKVRQASERMNYMNDMKQIALAMHNYHDSKGKMPKNANELIAAVPELQGSTAGSRLMSDEITMVWGGWKLNDQTQGTSITVMGWSMSPVFNGNVGVIYADGSVMQVPPADFANAQRPVFKAADSETKPTTMTRPTTKNKTR